MKVAIPYDVIYSYLKDISDQIQKMNYKPDVLISIGRGGMIPTRILSDLLNVKEVSYITAKMYTGIDQRDNKPTIGNIILSTTLTNKNILLIDDIIDSGLTVDAVYNKIKELKPLSVKVATILCKKHVSRKPSFYKCDCENDQWIVFPWELNEFKD